jgi:hypothetical protein
MRLSLQDRVILTASLLASLERAMRKKKYDEAVTLYALANRLRTKQPGRPDDFSYLHWRLEQDKQTRQSHLVADAKEWLEELEKKIKAAEKETS